MGSDHTHIYLNLRHWMF
ncbi:hypothetical protein Zm00014a_006647 [Zea mays]|uniref:Uncharacterized protein n=1 Tax=Zea mays TaxID=4577 RepID=A0A3L6E3Z0_MAIZE|nr:hypothetical protein Zm00014a_006647 [Zea mays]